MYLREIQGLRVVAALLVAIYHIWFLRVSGGVDVFFVISGFFLYRTLFKTDTPDAKKVITYYQRTLARVLPSASIVITATCLILYLIDMDSVWSTQIKSALASILFVENWWLAIESTDYLARAEVPSPFQQMWALSVQMQIYLALPLLLMFVAVLSRGSARRCAQMLAVLLVFAFAYALLEAWRNQPFAYFNTGARIWEFLAGVLLGYGLPYLRCSARTAKLLGHTALIVLTVFASVLPVGSLFPGLAALIPVLATVVIIVAAANGANIGLLNAPIMQRLGNISFTFYLWHWPLLIIHWQLTGTHQTGLVAGLGIILLAGLLAHATYAWAENPYRRSRVATLRPLVAVPCTIAFMLPTLAAAGIWTLAYVQARDEARAQLAAFHRGEAVEAAFVPATVIGKSDLPHVYAMGCVQRWKAEDVKECVFGNPDGSVTIVLVGGSHSAQWLPALQAVAKAQPDLRIITILKGNCPLSLSTPTLQLQDDCLRWSSEVVARLKEMQPDAVVTQLTTTRQHYNGVGDFVPSEFREVWTELENFKILAVRDNPRGEEDLLKCVDRIGADPGGCRFIEEATLTVGQDPASGLPDHVYPMDLTRSFCDGGICPAVIDGILVYRDASHVTATFAGMFADVFLTAFQTIGVLK